MHADMQNKYTHGLVRAWDRLWILGFACSLCYWLPEMGSPQVSNPVAIYAP